MPLEQGHLPNVPSISGYRLYHFKGVDAEKYQVLLELVRNHEDILFPHKGKIPLFEDIMNDFFPGLLLIKRSVREGEGYTGFTRTDHAFIEAHAALQSDIHTPLELRIYPIDETHARMGLVASHYEMHPIDDIARELADNNATYAMCEFKENGYRVCSLGGIDGIAMVLKNYTEARELFSQAHTLLLNGLFRVGDFETLFRDKNNHPNYAVRKASHEAYFTLLQQLLAKKGIGKSS